jgi:hypothetical protein
MSYWSLGLVSSLLAVGSLVGAENPGRQEKSDTLASAVLALEVNSQMANQKRTYEDIEIYRRLLGKSLLGYVHGAQNLNPAAMSSFLASMYTAQPTQGKYHDYAQNLSSYVGAPVQGIVSAHKGVAASPISIEGVYLPSIGILISAELPINFTAPQKKAETEPKKWSDWEREKRAFNGEKIDKPDEVKSRHTPDILETILRSLAANGYHLNGLKEGQHVTLALTFRPNLVQQCASCHHTTGIAPSGVTSGANSSFLNHANGALQLGLATNSATADDNWLGTPGTSAPTGTQPNKPVQSASNGATHATDGSANQLLLGDLHQKQGRYDEALATYNKAVVDLNGRLQAHDFTPPSGYGPRQVALIVELLELENRIIQCQLALKQEDKVTESVQKLKKWTNLLEKTEGYRDRAKSQAKNPSTSKEGPLPTKVIITASKELLDQAGNGKISFDEFAKRAAVEVLQFDQGSAKP